MTYKEELVINLYDTLKKLIKIFDCINASFVRRAYKNVIKMAFFSISRNSIDDECHYFNYRRIFSEIKFISFREFTNIIPLSKTTLDEIKI